MGDLVNALIKTNNLSDVANKSTARTNLGVPAGVDKQMCTAWASWSNNGTVCTIKDSHGVSSVTRIGLGTCQVNLSPVLANNNYSAWYQPAGGSDTVSGGSTYSKLINNVSTVSWQGQGLGAGINFQRYDFVDNNIHIYGGK